MRKAPTITKQEFEERLEHFKQYTHCPIDSKTIEKDLSKIDFDWENYEYLDEKVPKQLRNGLHVQWMYAGGDWEFPVYFILYWDGKKMRSYIPEDGNVYNRETKQAYGNEDDPIDEKYIPEPDFKRMEMDIVNRIEIV